MAPWVRNFIAVVGMTSWCAYVLVTLALMVFKDGPAPDFYVWGIPVALLTALPISARGTIQQQPPPQPQHPREDVS